jgi:hypothetical protein
MGKGLNHGLVDDGDAFVANRTAKQSAILGSNRDPALTEFAIAENKKSAKTELPSCIIFHELAPAQSPVL